MKTIEINLIGEYKKKADLGLLERIWTQTDGLSTAAKKRFIFISCGSVGILIISVILWLGVCVVQVNMEQDLKQKNMDYEKLNTQTTQLSLIVTKAKEEKGNLELKKIANTKVDNLFINWHSTLNDLASITPKDIKLTEILQGTILNEAGNIKSIDIKGKMHSIEGKSLNMISFMVLNINENLPSASILKNATIKKVEFNDQEQIYDFTISAEINDNETGKGK